VAINQQLLTGQLVVDNLDRDLGVGKITNRNAGLAVVAYFVSPAEQFEREIATSQLRPVIIENQTRCYVGVGAQTRAGRIIGIDDGPPKNYRVRFPNDAEAWVQETDLWVRCLRPINDPTEVLVARAIETSYFFNRRQDFLRSVTEQRAASQGLSALLSAGIKLYPHQAEVVRRVLEDPIQRYLLADEVGLGKTIEAGVLLRQFLIDDPGKNVYILVPGHLVKQWRQELEGKLGFREFAGRYHILSFDEIQDLKLDKAKCAAIAVDEAHHLVAGAFAQATSARAAYERINTLASLTPRLLLLSATPVVNNEREFLAMLHLLDPETYPLDDLEAFKKKVSNRQAIGKLLINLKESAHAVPLRGSLQKIGQTFADDARVQDLVSRLLEVVQDKEARAPLIRTIRVHLSETYRLHRRMLRNRRESVTDVLDHRGTCINEFDLDERTGDLAALLEEWRAGANRYLEATPTADRGAWQQLYLFLMESAGTWLDMLAEVVAVRLGKLPAAWLKDNASSEILAEVRSLPHFAEEKDLLNSLLKLLASPAEDGDRFELLLEVLKQKFNVRFGQGSAKVVLFTSFPRVAKAIAALLNKRYGEDHVAAHLSTDEAERRTTQLKRFQDRSECWILVADASGEEGLNLQHADAIVHFDVPFQPNRIEQRMGRLDRLGRTKDLRTWVLAGPDHDLSLHAAWIEVLEQGFGVFKQSIASLQFLVDETLPGLLSAAFTGGAEGLRRQGEPLGEKIEDELVRVAEQQALDEIDVLEQGASFAFERLKRMDAQNLEHWSALKGWADEALRFQLKYNENGAYTFVHRDSTLVPRSLLADYLVREDATAAVFNREEAFGKRNVRVFRIGHPFVDALTNYLHWDDRGKVYATMRSDPLWTDAEPWIGFYLTYLVEADPQPALDLLESQWGLQADANALLRRIEAICGPMFVPIAIDAQTGLATTNERVLKILSIRSTKDSDTNLGSRQTLMDQFISPAFWAHTCRNAREVSELSLRTMPEVTETFNRLENEARRQFNFRIAQLRQRLERSRDARDAQVVPLEHEVEREVALANAICAGIAKPRIRLDAIGFVVLTNGTLQGS